MPYLAVAIALVVAPRPSQGQAPRRDAAADRAAVHRAVLDYVEAFYEGDSTKLVRAVRPELSKFGFDWVRDSSRYVGQPMTWPAALSFVRRSGNGNGSRRRPPPRRSRYSTWPIRRRRRS